MIPNNGGSVPESQIRSPVLTGGGGGHVVEDNKALKKGPWTAAEDQILMEYVRKHGEGNWNSMQRNSGLNRCGKSCRLRWANHLRPHLKKGAFSPEEERHILALHAKYGNKWARMASQLPGRTDNEIKNYWNTRVKKRQRQGLPLYPHDISQSQQPQQSHSHSNSDSQPAKTPTFYFQTQSPTQAYHHHNLPPISPTAPSLSPLSSPHQPKPTTTMITSLPLFDPINTTTSSLSSSSSSFNFHRPSPILGTPLCYKQYRDSAGFSPPISPNPQKSSSMLRTHSMPDIASFQLSDTNSMSGNPSSHLNDTNSIPSIATFQLNDTTTMLDIDSFQLNNTNSMPDIVAFQLNETSSMSDIASFQLNTTNSMSDIFSCQIKNNNSMPGNITSFQLNDIGSIPDITSFPLNDTNLMSDIAPFQFSHTYPSLSPIPQSEFEYSGRFMPPTGSFYSVKSELPSNQVPQTPSEITMNTNVSSIAVMSSVEAEETHNNSGLLDDLLQEVDPLAGGGGTGNNSRRAMGVLGSCEEMHDLDGYDQWLQSTTSMESSLYGDVYVSC